MHRENLQYAAFFYVPFVLMKPYAAFSGKYIDRKEGPVHLKFSV